MKRSDEGALHLIRRSPAPAVTGWFLLLLWACALWLLPAGLRAAPRDYTVSPVPDWVQRIEPVQPTRLPSQQVSQGVYYLLSDTQVRVDAQDKVQFRHIAAKALNEHGVEAVAHVEIRFDPSYQSLALHMLQVRRGERVIAKLPTAQVKVLQRERELEYLIFDGSKTANVFLDDVRVGDVVEYAYSVRGSNPVFGNRHAGQFDLQGGVPLQHLHARLLWPRERPIALHKRNGAPDPLVTERGAMRELVWQARDLEALRVEEDAPAWFDPYRAVQWSEFKDWQSVARWAEPHYRTPQQLSPALQAEAERIAKAHAGAAERLVAVLRFVQREVRYMGVEIGPGSHAPSAPHQVLERRFGDCKDKSLLTMTLLQALGIEARAALVNTSLRRGIRELQPSPFAFNHVLVRATVDGRHYWLDPTRAPQPGDLAHVFQPDFEAALVVDPGTQALVAMDDGRRQYRRQIHTRYDAGAGEDKPVRYTVTSVLQGSAAEGMRSTLAAENREELQKRYLNYYARYHPALSIAEPMQVSENDADNELTVTEHYLIPDFWKKSKDGKRLEAVIPVPEVDQYLVGPRQSIRTAPLALAHPVSLTHTTEVKLPGTGWKIAAEDERIDDAHFSFRRVRAEKNSVMTLVDSFDSSADHVSPADTARYAASLERARKTVDLVLHQGLGPSGKPVAAASALERINWPIAMLAVLLLALWTWLALKYYRHDPPAQPAGPEAATLNGIRGWLILPAIGVVVLPLRLLVDMVKLVPSYAVDTWSNLTTVGTEAYHAMWAPLLLFELAGNLAYLVATLLLLVMFFQKRRGVPRLYIGVLAMGVTIQLIDVALAQAIPAVETTPKEWKELSRAVIGALIWGSYFSVSKRVRATFVHARRPEPPAFVPTQPTANAATP